MAMSATTAKAAGIAQAVLTEIQNGNTNFPLLMQWLAAAVEIACQADGGNVPTVNVPWPGGIPVVADNTTVNVPGL